MANVRTMEKQEKKQANNEEEEDAETGFEEMGSNPRLLRAVLLLFSRRWQIISAVNSEPNDEDAAEEDTPDEKKVQKNKKKRLVVAEFGNKAAVESLRYRAEDVSRDVTKIARGEARAKELGMVILNSDRLKPTRKWDRTDSGAGFGKRKKVGGQGVLKKKHHRGKRK